MDLTEAIAEQTNELSTDERISALEAKVDMLIGEMQKANGILTKIWEEVKPTIDSLLKSPMLKMLMPKGNK